MLVAMVKDNSCRVSSENPSSLARATSTLAAQAGKPIKLFFFSSAALWIKQSSFSIKVLTLLLFWRSEIFFFPPEVLSCYFFLFIVSDPFFFSAYSLLINCIQAQLGALSKPFLCLYSVPCLFSYCAAAFNHPKFPYHFGWILIFLLFVQRCDRLVSLCTHCAFVWVQAGNANLAENEVSRYFVTAPISATDSINPSIDFSMRNNHWLYSAVEPMSLYRI